MTFTVMIVTRNRRASLVRTLRELESKQPAPDEIIVWADACTDDTLEYTRTHFPNVRLFSNEVSLGSVGSRVRVLSKATGDWVLSIDDDSYPIPPDFFSKAADVIAAHPEAAAFCFPELRDGGEFSDSTMTSDSPGKYVSAYANCSGMIDLAFYRRQPGFPKCFHHMYEEPDYALQCYAGGKAVWFEPSLPIRHHRTSWDRKELPRHHANARNELWSVWMRCPLILLPFVSAFRAFRQAQAAFRESPVWMLKEPQWWWMALKGLPECLRRRQPVPIGIYLFWMRLPRKPIFTLEALKAVFPQS